MAEAVIGQNLGGCIILEEVGSGGMASVYKARRESDGADVAVKVLSRKLTVSPEFIRRFEREAILMKSFDHPHILPVYDFAQGENFTYIVMKLLDGGSLNHYAREKRLQVDEIVQILTQVASALDYAHSKSVIHRDLKPANVLMDREGHTYLSDFGIAKFKEESIGLTATGMMIGTPGYMSPEQWRSEPVDARTDVYAFGVMVFELFSGRLPFDADTPFALMYRHLDEPPPPVSRIRGDLPKTLDRVVRRSLAKVPEHRYPSAGAMVAAINEALKEAEQRATHQQAKDGIDQTFIGDTNTPGVWGDRTFAERLDQPTPATLDDKTFAGRDYPTPPTLEDKTFITHDQPIPSERTPSFDKTPELATSLLSDELDLEYSHYNAVDVGGRTLLERAKEAIQELTGEAAVLAQAIVHYVQDLRQQAKQKPSASQGPYRALESYDISDHKLFYGRELAIDAMLARSPLARFTVLHAESGAGKTSLVRAGLMPRLLAGGFLPLYVAVRRRPPHEAIKSILLPDPSQAPELANSSLRAYLKAVSQTVGSNREIFIFIDQFETFFTDVFTDEQRAEFVSEIAECLDDDLLPVRITLAMRTEYFGLLASFQPHVSQPFAHEFLLRSLTPQEAQRALILPARSQGYDYEDDVAQIILDDLANASHEIAPPQLQLVGGAMIEILPEDRKVITLSDYVEAGRAEGVLRGYLERLLGRFPVQERQMARLVIEGLVRADQTRDVRTRESLKNEFEAQGVATDNLDSVLHTLRENRVLRVVELENELAYELVHDYLALQVQLDPETAARKAAQELLDRRVGDFERYGSLLTEQELGIISAQQERLHLTENARNLIDQTRAIRRRQRRRTIALAVAAIIGLIGALGLGLLAAIRENQNRQDRLEAAATSQAQVSEQRDRANLAAQISQSGRVALQGVLELGEGQVDTALLLAAESTYIYDTQEARSSLLTSLESIPQLHRILYGHTGDVHAVAFSPTGELFASAGVDETIILWDVATDKPIGLPLKGSRATIWALAFSPDGKILASGAGDGSIRLWDVATHQQIGDPLAVFPNDVIYSLTFSDDGKWLASGHYDTKVRLWKVSTRRLMAELEGHDFDVNGLDFSPDGQLLASGGGNSIILWNISNPLAITQAGVLTGHKNSVMSVAFSPDGTRLASGSADNSLILWDIANQTPIGQPITDHTNWVRSVAFSPDGALLVSASHDRTIILRDPTTGQRLDDVPPMIGHHDRIDSLAFSPDSQRMVSGGQDGLVLDWNVNERQPLSHVAGTHQWWVYDVEFSPDGTQLVSASGDGTVMIRDAATGAAVSEPFGATDQVLTAALSHDGTTLAYGDADGWLRVWDLAGPELRFSVEAHPKAEERPGDDAVIRSVQFSPDDTILATSGDNYLIELWDAANGEELRTLSGHTGFVYTLAFSPDGQYLASGSQDKRINLWEVGTGNLIHTFSGHTDQVMSIAFSHDGQFLVSGSRDRSLIVWEVATGEPIGVPLLGHGHWVLSVAFSPDDAFIASGSRDGTIILWDVATLQAIGQPMRGHTDWVESVAFSPDGTMLVSGSHDMTMRLWQISLEAWRTNACAVANRNLTLEEWERFIPESEYRATCPS